MRGVLTTGVPFEAYVVLNDDSPDPLRAEVEGGAVAQLVYRVVTPLQADLLKRVSLEQHIERCGRWYWLSHPEHQGLLASARQRAKDRAMSETFLMVRDEMERRAVQHVQAKEASAAEWRAQKVASERLSNSPDNSCSWAPERKPHSSFLFYKLRGGQGTWVIYTRFDGSAWMVPMPAFDGWEEAMPPSLGTAEVEAGAYRLKDLTEAMLFLSPRSEKVRNSGMPTEIEAWASTL